jgi:CheY-like chemotaxis protein
MVHAYDFNMEVPSTPSQSKGITDMTGLYEHPSLFGIPFDGYNSIAKDDYSPRRNFKRRRSSVNSGRESPNKIPHLEPPDSPIPMVVEPGCQTPPRLPFTAHGSATLQHGGDAGGRMDGAMDYFSRAIVPGQGVPGTPGLFYDAVGKVVLNSRLLKLRELLHEAVHDSLRTGGRPDSTKISGTPHGERLNVEVAEAHSGEEERKQVEIEVIVDENVPDSMISESVLVKKLCLILTIFCKIVDGSYLMKMISAVFHNAFKFTPSGRITLNATVNASRQIIFSIVDTGEGIPSDFIPDLFKPFATEDESLTRHRDGLGLGLYVAKGIARKMGGDLWLEHTATEGQNRGSEFRIRLPITPADAGSTPGTPAPPTPGPLPDTTPSLRPDTALTPKARPCSPLTKSVVAPPPVRRNLAFDSDLAKKLPLRILVVEDNRINRALLCSMLKKLGYRDIEEARDGMEAVEMFKAALQSSPSGGRKRVFDLILMDLWMPRMDGYEAAERIVQLHNERRTNCGDSDGLDSGITVLAVSADATEEARAKAALKGIHGFVGKPFGIADLGKAVMDFRGKEILGERRLPAFEMSTTVR